MAVNVYEGMYILDANRYSRDAAAVSGQIPEMIQKLGGEVLASRLWEERRLAYTINGQRKGAYWLAYFKLDSGELVNLNRQCKLSESILRTLFVKVDPRIADALVSHALAGEATRRTPEPAKVAAAAGPAKVAAAAGPSKDKADGPSDEKS